MSRRVRSRHPDQALSSPRRLREAVVMTAPDASRVLFWRRTDVIGLERLALTVSQDAITAESTVVCVETADSRCATGGG